MESQSSHTYPLVQKGQFLFRSEMPDIIQSINIILILSDRQTQYFSPLKKNKKAYPKIYEAQASLHLFVLDDVVSKCLVFNFRVPSIVCIFLLFCLYFQYEFLVLPLSSPNFLSIFCNFSKVAPP